jgi:hypothetical protein
LDLDVEINADLGEAPLRRGLDPIALVFGFLGVFGAVGVMLALPAISQADTSSPTSPYEHEPFEYVEARLLKFGEVKDDTELPDRIVPALPTAPDEVLPLDTNENKPEPEVVEDEPERQRDAVTDDKLREVFDKARAFAEIQDDYIPEGHPDGVPDGDVTDPALASLGATYGHRIKRIFLERWIVPTLLSEAQLEKLRVKVNIEINADMTIGEVEFLKRSGNSMFDDSVQNAIDRVIKEERTLPPPPEAIAARIFGGGINLKFHGKDAQHE